MIITFFDLESSGLNTDIEDVHQVAYARYNTTTKTVMKANSFYMWEDGYRWTQQAADVTGITRDFLMTLPKEEMPRKYQEIYTMFNRADVCGYNNKRFDDLLLKSFMSRRSQPIEYDTELDVLTMARRYFHGSAGSLSELPARLGIAPIVITIRQKKLFGNQTQAHDATYDVAATMCCYFELLKRGIELV